MKNSTLSCKKKCKPYLCLKNTKFPLILAYNLKSLRRVSKKVYQLTLMIPLKSFHLGLTHL